MTCRGSEDALGIQKLDGKCVAVLGRGGAKRVNYEDSKDRSQGFSITYNGGDSEGCFRARVLVHHFKCDESISVELMNAEETEACRYEVWWKSKWACKIVHSSKLQSLEDEVQSAIDFIENESDLIRGSWSLKSFSFFRFMFYILLVFVVVNISVFIYNINKNPHQSYTDSLPFKSRYQATYQFVRNV